MKNLYTYRMGDVPPYKIFKAAQDLDEHCAVFLTEEGVLAAQEGTLPFALTTEKISAGEPASLLLNGVGYWRAGEDLVAGDLLSVGLNATAVKVICGEYIFARALSAARAGEFVPVLIVNAGYVPFDLEDDDGDWDTVKIFFGFNISRHRRYRGISMPNPRDDLTREEIKATGQYAVDNQLIKNALGEVATRVLGAALKKKEITTIFKD